jgi:hypothetical protein
LLTLISWEGAMASIVQLLRHNVVFGFVLDSKLIIKTGIKMGPIGTNVSKNVNWA